MVNSLEINNPIRVGLIGTGYAAKLRADVLQQDDRAKLVAVVGHNTDKTAEFAQKYAAEAIASVEELVSLELDLVIVATINSEHGAVCRQALQHGKHVVVEYPLSFPLNSSDFLRFF